MPTDTHIPLESSAEAVQLVENTLLAWWRELLGLGHALDTDDFFDLGGNSLVGTQLIDRINDQYGTSIGLATLFDKRTPRDLATLIAQSATQNIKPQPRSSSVLVPLQPSGSRPPLFWIPGGYGSTVEPFAEVSRLLGIDQPAYGLESKMPDPGQGMEAICDRATRFVAELTAFYPPGPYNLIGFCGGGFVAWEMAQQLSRSDRRVNFLCLVDTYDPRYPRQWHRRARFHLQHRWWRVVAFVRRGPIGFADSVLLRLGKLSRKSRIAMDRLITAMSGGAVAELPESDAEAEKRQMRAVREYFPEPCDINSVLLITSNYQFMGVSLSLDPRLAWRELSLGGSDVHNLPGDHLDSLGGENAVAFAKILREYLDRANSR